MVETPIAEWQTPWSGEYDPMNHTPNGAWYGRGMTSRFDRPLTINKMASMISYSQSAMGGVPPSRWELSRELAEELAADAVTKWLMSVSPPDVMKQIADGTLKICDVPIVLTPGKTPPAMLDPGCVEFVAAAVGENIARLEAESRSKNLQTLRVAAEYDRLSDAVEKATQKSAPVKEPNKMLGLRPPQEHADKRTHWVGDRVGHRSVWEWTIGKWFIPGISYLVEPDDIQLSDWKYLGPAEYNAQVVTPGKWCDADVARLMAVLRDKDAEILRLTSYYKQQGEKMRMLQAEVARLRSMVPEHLRPATSPIDDRIDAAMAENALKAANPLYKVAVPPTKEDIIRGYEMVCGGFGALSEPDVAPPPTVDPKSPIPLRALRVDRQTIGLRE